MLNKNVYFTKCTFVFFFLVCSKTCFKWVKGAACWYICIYIKCLMYAHIYMHVQRANKKETVHKNNIFYYTHYRCTFFYLFILCIMSIDLTCACEGYKIEIYKYLKGTIMYKKIIK